MNDLLAKVRGQVDRLKATSLSSIKKVSNVVHDLMQEGTKLGEMLAETPKAEQEEQVLEGLLNKVRGSLSSQLTALAQIEERREVLTSQCMRLEGLANQTRLLAMNARIETEHISGKNAHSFAVIANEIKEVAVQVLETTTLVQDVSDGLVTLLPKIETTTRDAETGTEGLYKAMSEAKKANDYRTRSLLETTETTTREMTRLAQKALGELQVHDVLGQGLEHLELQIAAALGEDEEQQRSLRPVGFDYEASADDLTPGQSALWD